MQAGEPLLLAPQSVVPAGEGAARQHEASTGTLQPCLSNLVIYTEDPADVKLVSATISQFIVKHPCRVIFIVSQPRNSPSKLEAEACGHTYSDSNGQSVSCDQITLRVTGNAVKEVAAAIQPLLVADLPIYIWWRGLFLSQRTLVEQLLTFADRFIFDGVSWTNIHFTVMQVEDFITRYEDKVGFTNFNWARLRPWRESAADFFDAGMFESEIWDLSQLRVEYMAPAGLEEGYQFRALLFVAWMAVQLEWEPDQGSPGVEEATLDFCDKKGAHVAVKLALLPQSTQTSQGLQRIVLTAQKEETYHAFSIERDHNEKLMLLCHDDSFHKTTLRTVPHAESTTADLLYRELGRRVRNRVFEKTFKMASKLLQMI